MFDVVVVGGGIAGLTVAYRLLTAGWQVICLEADLVPGGNVRTDRVGGLLCESGAHNVLEEPVGPVCRLAQDLGIAGEMLYPREKGNFIAWGGRLCSVPAQLYRVLSLRGLVRAGGGLLWASAADGHEESVAEWARRRFGTNLRIASSIPWFRAYSPETPNVCLWKQRSPISALSNGGTGTCWLGSYKASLPSGDTIRFETGWER